VSMGIVMWAACCLHFAGNVPPDGWKNHGRAHEIYETETLLLAAELNFLEGYSGQTTDELIALEGVYRTDSIVLAFEEALDQKADRIGGAGLSDEELVVLAVEALEREVNNGGHHQFFSNSSRIYAPMIVDALDRIGHATAARNCRDAIDLLGIEGPITVDAVERAIYAENEERDKKLDDLDQQYYTTVGDLSEPLFEFVKANKEKIVLQD